MKKVFCRVSLFLLVLAYFVQSRAYPAEVTAKQLEKALSKYVLSYNAYVAAKRSKDPKIKAKLPKYIKKYRESYSQYLSLLHEADLYKPNEATRDYNPAGEYNKKQRAKGRTSQKWKKKDLKAQREKIKGAVKKGKSVEEVAAAIDIIAELETGSVALTPEEQDFLDRKGGDNIWNDIYDDEYMEKQQKILAGSLEEKEKREEKEEKELVISNTPGTY